MISSFSKDKLFGSELRPVSVQLLGHLENLARHDYTLINKEANEVDTVSESVGDSIADAVIAKIKAEAEGADKTEGLEDQQRKRKETGPFDFACYIPECDFGTNSCDIYEIHVVTQHPGMFLLCYPGLVDIRLYGWKCQGRKWEI